MTKGEGLGEEGESLLSQVTAAIAAAAAACSSVKSTWQHQPQWLGGADLGALFVSSPPSSPVHTGFRAVPALTRTLGRVEGGASFHLLHSSPTLQIRFVAWCSTAPAMAKTS